MTKEPLCGYRRDRQHTKLRRRLEADAKSLFALYQYSRLHGAVRLRWGFLDEMLPASWVHRDEPKLHTLMSGAHAPRLQLEIVAGRAPSWADPWSRVRRAHVEEDARSYRSWLIGEDGDEIDKRDVQLARLAKTRSA